MRSIMKIKTEKAGHTQREQEQERFRVGTLLLTDCAEGWRGEKTGREEWHQKVWEISCLICEIICISHTDLSQLRTHKTEVVPSHRQSQVTEQL